MVIIVNSYFNLSTDFKLLRSGAECEAANETLGTFSSIENCSRECHNKKGDDCQFFKYSNHIESENCILVKQENRNCEKSGVNSWKISDYDSYEIKGKGKKWAFSN